MLPHRQHWQGKWKIKPFHQGRFKWKGKPRWNLPVKYHLPLMSVSSWEYTINLFFNQTCIKCFYGCDVSLWKTNCWNLRITNVKNNMWWLGHQRADYCTDVCRLNCTDQLNRIKNNSKTNLTSYHLIISLLEYLMFFFHYDIVIA